MIAKNYISSPLFIFDVLSTLPISEVTDFIASGGSSSQSYIKWLKQLKVFRILRLAKLSRQFIFIDYLKLIAIFLINQKTVFFFVINSY
jgi:type II restriction/modification system DNA methylase subunit YeeA